MEHSTDSQPRDSRLEKFSAAASHIILVERGLTSTALSKIRYLALEQHLSEDQVIECLDRIGEGSSTLGRVGRYEQMFLDRMANDTTSVRGTVLSPQTAQEAIQLATDEYQISASRAQQLLDYTAKERGQQQISAADAQNRIRVLVAQKFETPNRQRDDFEDELVAHAASFGVSADEVSALIDAEIETRNRLKSRRHRRLIMVAASILIAACVTGASCWRWLPLQTSPLLDPTTPQRIVDSSTDTIKVAETETIAEAPASSQNSDKNPMVDLSPGTTENDSFEVSDLIWQGNTDPVLKFARWQKRFVELVSQDFERSPPDAPPSSLADRQKMKVAIESLQSEQADERIQDRALDDLSALAKRIDDITPEEAKSIAAFCFRKHDASIEFSVLRAVKQLGCWPSFLLAVSDTFAASNQPISTGDWNQRIAFALTDGKLKKNDDFSASFFAIARLRAEERLLAIQRTQEAIGTNVEIDLASHLRLFISSQMNNRAHQSYFNRLIDARSVDLSSMQRKLELQQILIEALLLAKPDDESLAAGEVHFRRLNSVATMGDQLAQSRAAASALVTLHLEWLKRCHSVAGASSHRDSRWLEASATYTLARRLRDQAESIVLSGNGKRLPGAVEKYRSAIACGDRAITRSCLRGLMAIASNPTDRNGYQRQLDFVNGGQLGPYLERALESHQERFSKSDMQEIAQRCRQLRQTGISEASPISTMENKNEILAALNWLSNRRSRWSMLDLDLLLQIEAEATRATGPRQTAFSSLQLPWSIQATLPPVEVTPLVPLRR